MACFGQMIPVQSDCCSKHEILCAKSLEQRASTTCFALKNSQLSEDNAQGTRRGVALAPPTKAGFLTHLSAAQLGTTWLCQQLTLYSARGAQLGTTRQQVVLCSQKFTTVRGQCLGRASPSLHQQGWLLGALRRRPPTHLGAIRAIFSLRA